MFGGARGPVDLGFAPDRSGTESESPMPFRNSEGFEPLVEIHDVSLQCAAEDFEPNVRIVSAKSDCDRDNNLYTGKK